jgi:hypothetical protein
MRKSVVKVDHAFAMVPEWVLYADVSANAVRLYGVLRRFADQHSGECWPSRRLLGDRCKVSPATIDRALEELVEIGAVIVRGRVTDRGDRTSNLYTVMSVPNGSPVDAGGSPTNHPIFTDDETPLLTGDEGTKAIKNESQENDMATANAIARAWWESQKDRPLTPFMALVKILQTALKAGYEPERVERALSAFAVVPSAAQLERQMKGIVYGKRDDDRTAELARRAFAAADNWEEDKKRIFGGDSDEV